jgi:hypothetical protein
MALALADDTLDSAGALVLTAGAEGAIDCFFDFALPVEVAIYINTKLLENRSILPKKLGVIEV